MDNTEAAVWPREGYSPEWLALEDASGGRYQMTGNLEADCPLYDVIFSSMSKGWPQFEEDLEVWDETADESCQNTKVRIYRSRTAKLENMPLMIFFHGGGFVAGTLDTEDAQCRYFATKAPCLVMSVDYPKLMKPGLNFDVLINQYGIPSVQWCRKKAPTLGADVSQTVLCGGSAGAMFSAQIIHHYCVEKGDKKSVTGAVLWYPCVLPYTYGEDGKYKEMYKAWSKYLNGKVPIINGKVIEAIWPRYESDFSSSRHFAGIAEDLSNWPPTYLVSAEKDVFRDDAQILHKLLDDVNVPNKLDFYDDLPHWFHVFPPLAKAHTMMENSLSGLEFVLKSSKSRV